MIRQRIFEELSAVSTSEKRKEIIINQE